MLKSITFEVVGDNRLVCEGCEQRVERLLKALQGVGQVRAQVRNQRIEVLFDTAVLEAAAITERISKAGYQTKVVS
ncbi:heavy-metal-associated domain-containing protein [Methylocaldum sp. BRCS4]|jgi:copper chaperone|uniref:heavy-metal-associated domain-containing protein n=1 Tax=Methylocaldum sp. 14B TaxID=1912213 RepID=UPI00098A9BFE|nr:heavy metal-associated domain-containing protein [Methylocaldum sp. 14B]MVF23098.1 heavy-metal-associated domain-containing protein [Methylocaldum sp. BRCS4]